jgi:hypothetical protein
VLTEDGDMLRDAILNLPCPKRVVPDEPLFFVRTLIKHANSVCNELSFPSGAWRSGNMAQMRSRCKLSFT